MYSTDRGRGHPTTGDRAGSLSQTQSAPARPGSAPLQPGIEHGGHSLLHRPQPAEHRTRPRPMGGTGRRGAGRRLPSGRSAARQRADEGLHGGEALRGADLERRATGRGAGGGVLCRGDAGGRPATPPLDGLFYSWKRTRYAPAKAPDAEEEREAREEVEELKKGPPKGEPS